MQEASTSRKDSRRDSAKDNHTDSHKDSQRNTHRISHLLSLHGHGHGQKKTLIATYIMWTRKIGYKHTGVFDLIACHKVSTNVYLLFLQGLRISCQFLDYENETTQTNCYVCPSCTEETVSKCGVVTNVL